MSIATIVGLLVAGLLMIVIEVFLIPGFGVAGVIGFVSIAVGSWAAWTELGPLWGAAAIGTSVVGVGLSMYIFPKTSAAQKFVLSHTQSDAIQPARTDLLKQRGITTTPLRPIGMARFAEEEVDVISDGEYIGEGKNVVVVSVDGTRVVVRAAE